MSNEKPVTVNTETTETKTEDIVVEARVNKNTVLTAAIAATAGAAVVGAVAWFAQRNDNEVEYVEVTDVTVYENETPSDD